ncbi:MAG: DEAD/DEAH box helicase [Methylobacter sp.]|uniref:DEAD/DEAH box helicase n=1 Tax=Methylobacter sp. TaxID=2051955 RepID=UPI0025E44181|nr:DEAD/DEAH box helicase [Methylobacter sp.]MCK9622025.1 DEAD/DEAH box helicase [Methylobacter sp.]
MTKYTLRPYQQEAVDSAVEHIKKSLTSQVLVLPTAAGKSLIISEIAKIYHEISGKNVLCLAPSALLVKQNHEKYISYDGLRASIFCASLNSKSVRHPVIFASPLSVKNSVEKFKDIGLIILDECHLITASVKNIIAELTAQNSNLRVCGVTATPMRLGTGYIFKSHYKKGFIDEAVNPYFDKCTFEVSAKYLLEHGYITRPVVGKTQLHYETEKLELDKKGQYTAESIHEVYEGKGRLTSEIIADIVETTYQYKGGVLIFCSTIQHCQEALESLPKGISAMVTGESKDRKKIERQFLRGEIKYLCNVSTQTTGCDYPQTFCCALLRKSESVVLLTQMIGRVLRLHEDKPFALILDYADNIKTHFPDGDVFNPVVRARASSETETLTAICPECSHKNEFAVRPNDAGYTITENGYFSWPDTGDVVLDQEKRPVPAHFGRRCKGIIKRVERCTYKWTFKKCEKCEHENDIAARYCAKCKEELIDPNAKLELDKQTAVKQAAEKPLIEPVLNIAIEEDFGGDKRIKVVTVETILRKKIREFLRVSNEKERDKYRYYRDNRKQLEDKSIKFYRPMGKTFYKLIGIE